MRAAVVVFPGTNCERDCTRVLEDLGATAELLWHTERDLHGADVVLLPGGFAHGDYLRTGAIARFSPVMEAVSAHARAGGLVVGICNGFQVLCEAGLLPGALRKNRGLRFICRWVEVRVCNAATPFTTRAATGQTLRLPINHFEGGYYCDEQTLGSLSDNGQVVLRYDDNPNGSLGDIAGITSRDGNVLGLMPHPERACESLIGSEDGLVLLSSMVDNALRAA
ncbi:MAG TPA: phosphoribosylformylglycinamidine synthase subunit PurQ [Actinomycetota bacterium]|nr:phosphoribosylformylglycinamidine synthase subunit PurQ [Actinomycetota bacterium]